MNTLTTELQAQGVHTLLVQFTDLHGVAKGKLLPLHQLPAAVMPGAGFSGPSIAGTGLPRTGPRSEYWARADLATLRALPWMPGVAHVVADGFVDGEPFEACPRQVLRRALARLAAHGLQMQVGIEPEFFLLRQIDGRWQPVDERDRLDKPSYDLKSLPRQLPFLHALRQALEAAGLQVLQLDHEDAHGQYEVNFLHAEPLCSADRLMLFKQAAHTLAEQQGAVFSMMPKPFADQPGSGLHCHVSLQAADGQPVAPALLQRFIAGVLAHSGALCAVAAPTVNSYKRLTVGPSITGTTWAPAFVAHGPNNRTALVRTLPGRFEWRLPDASANPYLALATMIAAGVDGIGREMTPPPACELDLFTLPAADRERLGIGLLPQSLAEAVAALQADAVVQAALGPVLAAEFIAAKQAEWLAYARHVSDWEWTRYASAF